MTNEETVQEMLKLITQHGFKYEGELTCEGKPLYTRRWAKQDITLEIKVSMSNAIPNVMVIRNGISESALRYYSTPKIAFNSIRNIIRLAGFKM